MQETPVDMPCPVCQKSGNLFMIAHVDEIPYFGEHTQVTHNVPRLWLEAD